MMEINTYPDEGDAKLVFMYASPFSVADIDDCSSDPCQNGGECVDQVASYKCNCAHGWQGDVCTTSE